MLDIDGWRDCAALMDVRVFVDVDRDILRSRVIRRNSAAGIVDNLDKCAERGKRGRPPRIEADST